MFDNDDSDPSGRHLRLVPTPEVPRPPTPPGGVSAPEQSRQIDESADVSVAAPDRILAVAC